MTDWIRSIGCIFLFGWIISGCQQAPTVSVLPSPTLSIISLQYSPSLQYLLPLLHTCAMEEPRIALIVEERPTPNLDLSDTSLIFRLGAPDQIETYAAVLGQEKIAFIVHPSNPIRSLSQEQIRAIFSAKLTRWEQILPQSGFTGEIQVWSYPEEEDIQRILQQSLEIDPIAPSVFLAPNPTALRKIISTEPATFGFLPSRYLDSSVKNVELDDETNLEPFPVLLIAPKQPQGLGKSFILCVQESLQPIQ